MTLKRILLDRHRGYPAGVGIFYKCRLCNTDVSSVPRNADACRCRNIVVDSDAGRISVKDNEMIEVYEHLGTEAALLSKEAWKNFVAVYEERWTLRSDKAKFLDKFGNRDIAIVLSGLLGDKSLAWFDRPIDALQNRSPSSVLSASDAGETIVRALIMRFPA